MRMHPAAKPARPVNCLIGRPVLINVFVFLLVLVIGRFPLKTTRPLHIGRIINRIVNRIKDGNKMPVITGIDHDHINQRNIHPPAVIIQKFSGPEILHRLLTGQILIQMIPFYQSRRTIRHVISRRRILLLKRLGKTSQTKGTGDQAGYNQKKDNSADDVKRQIRTQTLCLLCHFTILHLYAPPPILNKSNTLQKLFFYCIKFYKQCPIKKGGDRGRFSVSFCDRVCDRETSPVTNRKRSFRHITEKSVSFFI